MSNITPLVLIAYHDHCMDGYTAAYYAAQALSSRGYDYKLLAMSYDEESYHKLVAQTIGQDLEEVYIVDFSVPIWVLEKLSSSTEVTVLDHHKTAFEMYAGAPPTESTACWLGNVHGAKIVLDNNRSGAGLVWEYFHEDSAAPWLVRYVEDRDLWKFRYGAASKQLHAVLATEPRVFNSWALMERALETRADKARVLAKGEELLKQEAKVVKELVFKATPVLLDSKAGLLVECPGKLASVVGNELAKLSGTFGACVFIDTDKCVVKWSLRSEGDYDVSAMAKVFGGGGHKNAAGFEVDLIPFGGN